MFSLYKVHHKPVAVVVVVVVVVVVAVVVAPYSELNIAFSGHEPHSFQATHNSYPELTREETVTTRRMRAPSV